MKITKRDAVRIAIFYGEVFDYPLTEEEVRVWAPYTTLGAYSFSIASAKRLFSIRKQREAWSREKWIRARRVAILLKLIPTITLVGVTGGLTRSNVRAQDDIDFLIITTKKALWVTRALSTMLLDLMHLRRRPGDAHFSNLICLNMFMSEDGLAIPVNERDLFTAHEVLLMTPIWECGGAYKKFLTANRWVRKFLLNAWEEKHQAPNTKHQLISKLKIQNKPWVFFRYWNLVLEICLGFGIWCLRFVEVPTRVLQLWYMSKRRSTEIVTNKVIRFHPHDARVWIKRELGRRLARFNIPLDKIFYGR